MDGIELEVFRAGRASRGISPDDLASLATAYDGTNPVPVCIGHPKSDTPSKGEIVSFRAAGSSLFATIKNLSQDIVDGVKKSELLNRSMAFFSPTHEANPTPGKLAPRHLGFLGASAPGIPNLPRLDKALAFSADGETLEATGDPAAAVIYEGAPTPVISFRAEQEPSLMADNNEPTAAELQAERDRLAADRLAFAAEQQTTRQTANAGLVDNLIAGGKLLPADRDRTLFVFNALAPKDDEGKALEFDAGDKGKLSPAAALAALLGGGVKLVPLGERESPSREFDAGAPKTAESITSAARKLMKDEPALTFEAAVERVTDQQEG